MFTYTGLPKTNNRLSMLRADFSGLENLEEVIMQTLTRLKADPAVSFNVSSVYSGTDSISNFDNWFSEVVRKELGATLGKMRNKAMRLARSGGAGSASSAIRRRMYKDRFGGNINWATNRRISNRKRVYVEGTQRTVSDRTRRINEYYGPDRSFILRWLNAGTDVRTVDQPGRIGRGSQASWGRRGAIEPRNFFDRMGNDMNQAAEQLGKTLIGKVKEFVDKQFKEI